MYQRPTWEPHSIFPASSNRGFHETARPRRACRVSVGFRHFRLCRRTENGFPSCPRITRAILREAGFSVWTRQPGFVVGAADDPQRSRSSPHAASRHSPSSPTTDRPCTSCITGRALQVPPADGGTIHQLTDEIDLYLFPAGARSTSAREAVRRVPGRPAHPAPAAGAAPRRPSGGARRAGRREPAGLVDPRVDEPARAGSNSCRDLSGDNPVVVGGVTRTITTRYSDAMFPTPLANALRHRVPRGAGGRMGLHQPSRDLHRDRLGCGGVQARPWQNLIFIVPGQVDYGQHQQVLFVNHYDTISYSTAASNAQSLRRGRRALRRRCADRSDAHVQGLRVQEHARLRVLLGERSGSAAPGAYVRQHPTVDMWRAVNMDQTGVRRRRQSPDGRLQLGYDELARERRAGRRVRQANADYGSIIAPGEHRPGHEQDVPDRPLPVLGRRRRGDRGARGPPQQRHLPVLRSPARRASCHDTVTQIVRTAQLMFTQDYSWPSEKAAIAVVAHLAEPLYACPAAPVAAPVLTPGTTRSRCPGARRRASRTTSWSARRAAADPFTGIASSDGRRATTTSALSNGVSYAYRIRTCPTQVSACVTAAPTAGRERRTTRGLRCGHGR